MATSPAAENGQAGAHAKLHDRYRTLSFAPPLPNFFLSLIPLVIELLDGAKVLVRFCAATCFRS
jgi:hypothetical protein